MAFLFPRAAFWQHTGFAFEGNTPVLRSSRKEARAGHQGLHQGREAAPGTVIEGSDRRLLRVDDARIAQLARAQL
ncbi:MAG: hypothetical protein RMJ88_16655 [Thermogemmata sp.]|nr:hypothetical protein [Thermogemmata sp.]